MNDQPKNITRTVDQSQPLDDIASRLMTAAHREGRGFLLSLRGKGTDADPISIEVKESLKPIDDHQGPAALRQHTLTDTASFVAYAQRFGTKDKSIVMLNEQGGVLVINEEPEKGARELINLALPVSDDWRSWTGALGVQTNHRGMLDFLLKVSHTLEDPGILQAMRSLKLTAKVDHESDIHEDGKNVGFMIKVNGGEELKKFPKSWDIMLPVLEVDCDPDQAKAKLASATIRLEVDLPAAANEAPTFRMICSTWKQVHTARIREECDAIAEQLEGWLVVRGNYDTKARPIGRGAVISQ